MKDVPYLFLSTKTLFTESFFHICFRGFSVILNCKSIIYLAALVLEGRLTLWLKLFTKPFVNLLRMQMRKVYQFNIVDPRESLKQWLQRAKNLFIYHYCHGLSQMMTICLHPIFRQWATIESRKPFCQMGEGAFIAKCCLFFPCPIKLA